ncbi:AbiH family protein [Emticicia sp. SJ17W-69]|uniref:AbiH family protein n=1 Tax=Emticicia sp. SJ17W-69 TaxID=3421657 RepID=UPI003EC15708
MTKENTESNRHNTLILIGNGFDLAHEMPIYKFYDEKLSTSYRDFIISQILKDFIYQNLDDTNLASYPRYLKFDNPKGDKKVISTDMYSLLRSGANLNNKEYKILNSFFGHLMNIQKLKGWVDIECEYFDLLTFLFETGGDIFKFNEEFSLIIEGLKKHLQDIEINIKKECKPKAEIQAHFDEIIQQYTDIGNVQILNFNYTSTPELYLTQYENRVEVNYIHGKLFDEQNPIIFGYGDEAHPKYKQIEDSGNKDYLKFLKSYAYLQTNNYHNFLRFIDSDNFDVVIMGHSCGMSDGVMLKTIFEHPNCQNIIIKYYQYINNEGKAINDFFVKTQEIARHFSDKAMFRKKVLPISNPAVTPLIPV